MNPVNVLIWKEAFYKNMSSQWIIQPLIRCFLKANEIINKTENFIMKKEKILQKPAM